MSELAPGELAPGELAPGEPAPGEPTPGEPAPGEPAAGTDRPATTARRVRADLIVPAIAAALWEAPEPASSWPRRRRWLWAAIAILLAGGLFAATLGELTAVRQVPWPQTLVAATLLSAPVVLIATAPLNAWRLMSIGFLVAAVSVPSPTTEPYWPITAAVFYLAVLWVVGRRHQRLTCWGVGIVTITALAVLPEVFGHGTGLWFTALTAGVLALPIYLGRLTQERQRAEAVLAHESQARQADQAEHAVLAERARIARELHDVVSHHMSVIAIQAEAAPLRHQDLPDDVRATFGRIEDSAREAMREMRRIVTLLRSTDDLSEREPQPTAADVSQLVGRIRDAGHPITLTVMGAPAYPLPIAVDLSIYRIVQESVSNALKHAPGQAITVAIGYRPDAVTVDVVNRPHPTGNGTSALTPSPILEQPR